MSVLIYSVNALDGLDYVQYYLHGKTLDVDWWRLWSHYDEMGRPTSHIVVVLLKSRIIGRELPPWDGIYKYLERVLT